MTAPGQRARVGTVIVNYRAYDELRTCLSSLARSHEPGPVVVVDHATNPAEAEPLAREYPGVEFLSLQANDGFAAGVNLGARRLSTPYLLLVNPDCVVAEDVAGALADWMDAHPDVGVVGPRIRNRDGSVQASARRFPDLTTAIAGRSSWLTRVFPGNFLSRRNLPGRDGPGRTPVEVDWVSGACMLLRRAAFNAAGGMDERFFLYWEDADLCRRLAHRGLRTVYFPAVEVVHTGACSSRHAEREAIEAFHRSAFRLFWKHASAPARLAAPLVFLGLQLRLAFVKQLVSRRRRLGAG